MEILLTDPLWLLIAVGNIITVFLIILNGYLRGSLTPYVDVFLGALILGIFVSVVILYGWIALLVHILGSFIVGAIFQPLAARLVKKLRS